MNISVQTFAGLSPSRRLVCTDAAGVRGVAILRGFNISGHCKLTGVPCSPAAARTVLEKLAADGFNLVRLPVIWEHLDEDVGAALLAFVREAEAQGMFVLVDLHQDLLGSAFRKPGHLEMHGTGFPEDVLRRAYGPAGPPFQVESWDAKALCIERWQVNYRQNRQLHRCLNGLPSVYAEIAAFAGRVRALFTACNNVIGYEVINEPMAPLVDSKYHDYYHAVREALGGTLGCAMPAADWMYRYLVGKLPVLITHGEPLAPGMDPTQMRDLALSTPHLYDPIAMAGLIAPTGEYSAALDVVRAWHEKYDLPFLIGEFGVPASLHRAADVLATWVALFEAHAVSWCLWNLNPEATGDGNDHWCDEHMSVASRDDNGIIEFSARYTALLRPFVTVASGATSRVSFTRDRFGWHFSATIGRTLEAGFHTKIVVPPMLGDFNVNVFSGPSFKQAGRIVTFDTDLDEVSFQIDETLHPE